MTVTAMAKIGIMVTNWSVHIVTAMGPTKIEFFSLFLCRCHGNVNKPLVPFSDYDTKILQQLPTSNLHLVLVVLVCVVAIPLPYKIKIP